MKHQTFTTVYAEPVSGVPCFAQNSSYLKFLSAKEVQAPALGFTPTSLNPNLKDFQADLVTWALERGRAAIFAERGLGKALMELAWAQQVVRHTGQPVLILAPLAVSWQLQREGNKFQIGVQVWDGEPLKPMTDDIVVANYEKLDRLIELDMIRQFSGVALDMWQRYASPVWFDINRTDVLNAKIASTDEDEKHLAPLQLEVVRRCVQLWTNPGELVFTPFLGVGSEVYGALQMNRRGEGIELKPEYFAWAEKNCRQASELASSRLFGLAEVGA